MTTLPKLIAEGKQLVKQIERTCDEGNGITSDQAVSAKTLHTNGKFLLKKIDSKTRDEYNNLFSKTSDLAENYIAQALYIKSELERCLGILTAVLASGAKALDKSGAKVFISHGKITPAFTKLVEFLSALSCSPIYDTSQPYKGQDINQHVERLFSEAAFYVILAIGETKRGRQTLPSPNVLIEFDRLVQDKKDNFLLLLEEGTKMPTMQQNTIHHVFSQDCLDGAFTKLVQELRAHNLIR